MIEGMKSCSGVEESEENMGEHVMQSSKLVSIILLLGIVGCSKLSGVQEGSEEAARAYLAAEFDKWIAGRESEAETMSSRTQGLLAPMGYEFRSVVPDKPDFLAFDDTEELPDDWRTWPAYRFNVYIDWKSQAGTPLQKATTYTMTWNAREKKWYVTERFL